MRDRQLRLGLTFSLTCGALLATAGPHAARGQPAVGRVAPPPAAQRSVALDRVVDSAVASGFSGLVLVGSIDSVLYERAVGLRDRASGEPLRADAVWRWASVTKQVTAALVMQQVDSGRLALDAPVVRYLPDFAGPTGATVTLRQLLQHTSGLPNPEDSPRDADDVPRFYRARGATVGDRAAALGYCAGAPKRAPGAAFEYDNCDYLVLGAILERATGRPYATLVRERFSALGMHSVRVAEEPSRGVAAVDAGVPGWLADGRREPPINLATYGAAGAVTGTGRDLLAFDRVLLAHRLVSPAGTATMWQGEPRLGYVALGAWAFSAPLRGCAAPVTLIERRGQILGVQIRNVIAPELDRAVIVLTNAAAVDFGEVWQGSGLTHALLSAALCDTASGAPAPDRY